MDKLNKIFKLYILSSAVMTCVMFFGLWLLGKSDNKLCRSMWQMIASEYGMAFLIIARPFMSQTGFDHAMKQKQDQFAQSMISLWKACGIVK